ncbi:hypothetical protein PHYC_01753 [Phycisphaerales bacterium]|nr:hypothetical protein PHYC_01753 [Phycisphaerales bacterium]
MRTRPHLAAISMLVLCAGAAPGEVLSGNVKYLDATSVARPARRVKVEMYAVIGGGGVFLGATRADISGDWSADVGPVPGATGYFVHYVADNDATTVGGSVGGAAYAIPQTGMPGSGTFAPFVIDTITSGGPVQNESRAFAVADAMQTSWLYAEMVRGSGPAKAATVFPGAGAFYSTGTSTIHIPQENRFAWDVIGHEYGHRLAHLDSLDMNPGGYHQFGTNNIGQPTPNHPVRSKLAGLRLAWGEGLGTYMGTAAQAMAPHPDSFSTGDTWYTSYDVDTPANTFHVNIETHDGSPEAGEGDETSVMRILWDLADGTGGSEAHDRVSLGHNTLYDMINDDIAGVDELDDLWDYLVTRPGATDALRIDYGAIFEQYGVSPHPMGVTFDGPPGMGFPAPTFEWERQNDDRNDLFNLIVFTDDLSSRILDIAVPGDTEFYTLTEPQWTTLLGSGFGNYKWVIAGSDTTTYTSGSYWSDARLVYIPSAGSLALLAVAGGAGLRRRRR